MAVSGNLPGKLSALKIAKTTKPGHYGDGAGLYLQVAWAGTKSWCLRYKVGPLRREMGLGKYPTVSLQEARVKAFECQRIRAQGLDPILERNKQRQAVRLEAARSITFRDCAERYIETNKSKWHNEKHSKQWASTLERYAYPALGSLPVQQVDQGLVMEVLEPIWNTKIETAARLRGRIEIVLGWATTLGYRDGLNPARWKGHLELALPSKSRTRRVEHHKSIPHKEIASFVEILRQQEGIGALALEFTLLTAARTNEVLGATWREIDLEKNEWRIAGSRMKARKPHRVPLSEPALAVIRKMLELKRSEFIFPGQKDKMPLSNMSMLKVRDRMGRSDITVHGCRSTFRNWAGENGFPRELAERALAHAVGNSVEAAYYTSDLLEKRRPMMEKWAQYCSSTAYANLGRNVQKLFPDQMAAAS
jgi:integrase